ncbi:hypothetical protein Aduo_006899 [Ancylostoma duodenale]
MPVLEISDRGDVCKETVTSLDPKDELQVFMRKLLYESTLTFLFFVVAIMRLNFTKPSLWSISKVVNAVVTTTMIGLACYSLIYTMHITFTMMHSPMVMSSKLLLIAWGIQSMVSLVFLVYWQLNGHITSFQQSVVECQNGVRIRRGKDLIMRNIRKFYLVIFVKILVVGMFCFSYYFGNVQSDFAIRRSKMFYYPQLRFMNSFITLYTYIAWNASMFIYIIHTNATFLEVKYFNDDLEKLDGAADDVESKLFTKMETYGRLCGLIRELDRVLRLYAFIMLVIIIPTVIFTLMMLTQQMRALRDLIICLPSTALCAYGFLGSLLLQQDFTMSRSKVCLIRNKSIWFPCRRDVFTIAQTFSVMAMVLSMIVQLTPALHAVDVMNCSTSNP